MATGSEDFDMSPWWDPIESWDSEPAAKTGKGEGSGAASSGSGPLSQQADLQPLVLALASLILDTALVDHELDNASTIDTILLPCQAAMAIAGLKESMDFHEQVKERKGEDLGSSHLGTALMCLRAIPNEPLDPAFRALLHSWWLSQGAGEDPSEMGSDFWLEGEEEFCKHTVSLKDQALLQEIARLQSSVPKTQYKERKVQELLQAFMKK